MAPHPVFADFTFHIGELVMHRSGQWVGVVKIRQLWQAPSGATSRWYSVGCGDRSLEWAEVEMARYEAPKGEEVKKP